MKKHMRIVFVAVLAVSLFSGCGRKVPGTNATVPTVPLATVAPTRPTTEPTRPPMTVTTVPSRETTEETMEATIEDGNGPIASQDTKTTEK